MKKIIGSALLLLLIVTAVSAKKVEPADAEKAGLNYYFRQLNRMAPTDLSTLKVTGRVTISENGTALIHIFDINRSGFIMVAADDASYPVLGYSFESVYSRDDQPANFRYWLNNYKDQLRTIIGEGMQADAEISSQWTNLLDGNPSPSDHPGATTDVLPLLTSNWDQGYPYNTMCPPDPAGPSGHVLVGCVATAMAQVMYYWRYPSVGQGSHCDSHWYNGVQYCADFANSHYDWNGAADQPSKECDPVALISYHAGIAVNMSYGAGASGAYASTIPGALKNYFRYSSSTYYQSRSGNYTSWVNQIKSDLNAGRPVIYGGYGPDGGHCFVADGYQGTDMFHFNWGWSGSNNGYFNINNLNPGGMTFNNGQDAVFNIQPDATQYPAFCSGATNVNTYGFGTIEDGSGPVADYQNNENCSWLIGPDDSIKSISLTFMRFGLAAGDAVKVYDGATTAAPLLGTFTGSSLPPSVTSTGSRMLVTFTSDNASPSDGWLASYTCTYAPFCESVTVLSDLSGEFYDGSGRFQYRNSNICKWKIMPACWSIGSTTLTFTNFDTEENNDKVQVYDQTNGALLATFSGNYTTPPAPVTSPSGKFLVIFNTNSSVRGEGWKASYSVDCLNVGMEEKGFGSVVVYPNPASGRATLEFTLREPQPVVVHLADVGGRVLLTLPAGRVEGKFSGDIDLSAVPAGFYILRLEGEKTTYQTKLIVN